MVRILKFGNSSRNNLGLGKGREKEPVLEKNIYPRPRGDISRFQLGGGGMVRKRKRKEQ